SGQMREFNLDLLGKWCWRLLVDKEGLWFRVLGARYGMEGGKIRDGGRRGSSWWRDITRIREGDRSLVEGIPLCERFGRLFNLAETKSRTVGEMFLRGSGVEGEAWEWRRQLRVWEEEMLGESQSLLPNLTLQDQSSDR
ncbi:hypothetical protein TSUD_402880, partial [Trifolium subterraneum]